MVSQKPSDFSNILGATAYNAHALPASTATTTSTITTCAGTLHAAHSQVYTTAYPGPVASHFENASRIIPVTHQAPSTTISNNLTTEAPPFFPRRVIPFVAQHTLVELNRDVGKVVRQWNLKFNGSSKASAEDFLTRVDECEIFSPLSDIELISALPLLLTGVALRWYRLKKSQWTSCVTSRAKGEGRLDFWM